MKTNSKRCDPDELLVQVQHLLRCLSKTLFVFAGRCRTVGWVILNLACFLFGGAQLAQAQIAVEDSSTVSATAAMIVLPNIDSTAGYVWVAALASHRHPINAAEAVADGWTLVGQGNQNAADLAVFARVMSGESAAMTTDLRTFNLSGTEEIMGVLMSFSGVDVTSGLTSAIPLITETGGGSALNPTAPDTSGQTTVENAWVLRMVSDRLNTGEFGGIDPPPGHEELAEVADVDGVQLAVARAIQSAPGSPGSATFDDLGSSNRVFFGLSMALNPVLDDLCVAGPVNSGVVNPVVSGSGVNIVEGALINDGVAIDGEGISQNRVGDFYVMDLGGVLPVGTTLEFNFWQNSTVNNRNVQIAQEIGPVYTGTGTNLLTDSNPNTTTWTVNYTLTEPTQYISVFMSAREGGRTETGRTETTEVTVDCSLVVGLDIDKDTSTPNRNAGEQATYSMVITNTGDLTTANEDVIVTDTLPAGFTFASASFTRTGSATGPGGVTNGALTNNGSASVPEFGGFTIPAGDTITITLVADISGSQADGTYSNAVTASSNTAAFPDATDDGLDADEDVTVTGTTVLSIDKDTSTPNIFSGQQVTYSIVFTNTGSRDSRAEDVIITDTFSAGFTFASASFTRTGSATGPGGATNGALTNNGTAAIPQLGGFTVPAGDSITVTLIATVDTDQVNGTYSNAVTASSNTLAFTAAIDDGSDTDEDVTVLTPGACTPGPVNSGAANPVVAVSGGVDIAQGALINDGAAINDTGIGQNAVGEWYVIDLGTVLPTDSTLVFDFWQSSTANNRNVQIAQEVGPVYTGTGTNLLTDNNPNTTTWAVNYTLTEPTQYISVFMSARGGGRTETTEVTVDCSLMVALDIDKDTSTPNRNAGEQATYSMVITNTGEGTTASEDVIVTDILPVGFTFASASFTRTGGATGPGGATSGVLINNGSATLPEFGGFTIPGGDTITITLVADISGSQADGTYSNAVTASSNSADFTAVMDDGTDVDEDVTIRLDTDGEGFSNSVDFDDDNDGISDALECTGPIVNEDFTNLGLAGFNDGLTGDFVEDSGMLNGFTYASSPGTENGTIRYSGLRGAVVGSAPVGTTLVGSNSKGVFIGQLFGQNDTRGEVTLTALSPQVTTLPNGFVLESEIRFIDLDGAPSEFLLEINTTTGPITDLSEFNARLNGGNGTASLTVTEPSPNVFRFLVSAPAASHNTDLFIQIPNRVVSSYTYNHEQTQGFSSEFILFPFFRIVRTCLDTDGDSIPDFLDLDSDNDGISDLVESGQNASIVDADGNGVHDDVGETYTNGISNDANGGLGVTPVNSDMIGGDGLPDFLDLDSDGDGIPDSVEAQTTQIYTSAFANDGDVSDNDNDGDGVIAVYDPDDGGTGEFGGLFNIPVDTDGDEMPDYLDTDSDGDGESDESESGLTPGVDSNGDGIGDGVGASYSDPDGDTHTGSGGRRNVFRRLLDSDNDTRANGSDAKTIAVDFDYRDFSDFDDIPASFGDASHGINTGDSTGLFLGSGVERDETGPEGVDGVSDTEDDGVIFQSLAGGGRPELDALVTVTNDTGAPAVVCGWLDGGSGALPDGDFNDVADQPDNAVCQVVPIGGGTLTFEWSDLPSGAAGQSFARFRVCVTQSDCDSPFDATRNAAAPIGEVEGYLVRYDFTTTAVSIGEVNLRSIDVNELLKRLGAEGLSRSELLKLFANWNESLADSLETADIPTILELIRGYLDPDGDGNVALLGWETLYERGTVGFEAERETPNGGWVQLNQDMLPAMASPLGGTYMFIDTRAVSGELYRYRLIEIEATGLQQSYGPFDLVMP